MMKSESDIPKFDLAEQIMAGQRKFAAVKRVAPKIRDQRLKTTDTRLKAISHKPQNTDQTIQKSLKSDVSGLMSDNSPEQIISEIVARDIRNLRAKPLVR